LDRGFGIEHVLKNTYDQSNDDILSIIKAILCSNSGLLHMKGTTRVRKIALLGKFAYPELRLSRVKLRLYFASQVLFSYIEGAWYEKLILRNCVLLLSF
jgi:hypothetical protein